MNGISLDLQLSDFDIHNHGLWGLKDLNHDESKLQFLKNQIYFNLMQKISNTFGERVIALKGMSLLGEIYADFGMRSLGDLDILVRDRKTFDDLILFLLNDKFSIVNTDDWEANNFKKVFSKYISGIEIVIELHEKLFFNSLEPTFIFRQNFSRFWVLEDSFNVYHLVHHLSYQHTFIKLSWLYDLYLIYKRNPQVFFQVKKLSEEFKLTNSYDFAIKALEVYFQLNMSEYYIDSKNVKLKLLTRDFLIRPERHLFRYYAIKHFTKDSFLESLRYDILWFKMKLMKQISRIIAKKNSL